MWAFNEEWSWSGFAGMLLTMALVVGMLVAVIWIVARWFPHQQAIAHPLTNTTAQDVVRQRYARGEIDRETYRQMMQDLTQPGAGSPTSRE
jgi:putative membrane protein